MKKIIMLSALVLLAGCTSSSEITKTEIPKSREIFVLKSEKVSPVLKLTGNVEAKKQVDISAKIVGRIDAILADIGDEVYKGQILARYSAVDNDSLIQYQSALSQFKSTQASAENIINTAKVQMESTERAFEQVKKEEQVQRQKQYDTLKTNAKLSEITISNILNFLDKNLEATNKFKGMSMYKNILGVNNSILKNDLKNKVENLSRNFAGFSDKNLKNNEAIIAFARQHLDFLHQLKAVLQDFDSLVRGTPTSTQFSESMKNGIVGQIANYLHEISGTIANLENLITGTEVLEEQLGLKVLAAENQLENAKSGVELAESNAENQVVAARSQVNIAANYKQEMIVKAPFAGVITNRMVEVGQLVAPGQKLFQLADISGFKVKTEVPDNFAGMMTTEMPVVISVDGINGKFAGIVTKVNPALNPQTRKLGIEITFVDPEDLETETETEFNSLDKLKVGLFARITIELPEQEAFKIPRNFIEFDYDGAKIHLENGETQKVDILSEDGDKVEIYFDGIKEGLKIVK